jgi:hypothetical protein
MGARSVPDTAIVIGIFDLVIVLLSVYSMIFTGNAFCALLIILSVGPAGCYALDRHPFKVLLLTVLICACFQIAAGAVLWMYENSITNVGLAIACFSGLKIVRIFMIEDEEVEEEEERERAEDLESDHSRPATPRSTPVDSSFSL